MKDNMDSKGNTFYGGKTKKLTEKEIVIKFWQLTKYGGWESEQCLRKVSLRTRKVRALLRGEDGKWTPWAVGQRDVTVVTRSEWLLQIREQLKRWYIQIKLRWRLPGGSDGKSICLQCGKPGFDPWIGKIPWRRKWQPTPVFLPGESHGKWSLAGYSPWGCRESDMTEQFHLTWLEELMWSRSINIISPLAEESITILGEEHPQWTLHTFIIYVQ